METFDPFGVLGLPRRYDVDAGEVERAYLERSSLLHPDVAARHAMVDMGGEDEEEIAALNRARQTLGDAEQRAIALWGLSGGVESKDLPPGFLMEMMEVREEIESAAGDGAAMRKWGQWAEERREAYQRRVAALFASMGSGADAGVLKRVKMELNAWRYVERLIEQM